MKKSTLFFSIFLCLTVVGAWYFYQVIAFGNGGEPTFSDFDEHNGSSLDTEDQPPAELGQYVTRTRDGGFVSVEQLVNYENSELLVEDLYTITDDDMYGIYYNYSNHVIFIRLYREPLTDARRLAEANLVEALSLQDDEICKLGIRVTTNHLVNPEFSDFDLGLSFCPNAISLPIR